MKRFAIVILVAAFACRAREPKVVAGGDAKRGRDLVVTYDCIDCHAIPGLKSRKGAVQQIPLGGIAYRPKISRDRVENTPENVVLFVQRPKSLNPGSAMPGIGARERDARDIAAFLMTLD